MRRALRKFEPENLERGLVRVFVAASVGEVDLWSLSHVALALSGLGHLVAICTCAFCVWALRPNEYAAEARSEMPCGNGRAAWRTRTKLTN
jgi:Na+/glutamate symporter